MDEDDINDALYAAAGTVHAHSTRGEARLPSDAAVSKARGIVKRFLEEVSGDLSAVELLGLLDEPA